MVKKKRAGKKKKKFSFKIFILFILFEVAFSAVTAPLIVFYGPFKNLRKTVVGAAMSTLNHQYIATTFLSDKKIKDALHMLNELMYKGYKISYVLSMVERQFNLLFKIKICLEERITKEEIMKELNIKSEYGYSIMVKQSKKFTINQLKKAVELCLNTEKRIKSSSIDEKTEMELLIINTTA